MAKNLLGREIKDSTARIIFRVVLLVGCSLLAWGALAFPIAIRPSLSPLQVGDVADQDIQAPRSLTYTSQELTDQAKQDAQNKVDPVYLPTDPSITRQQIEKLRVSLNYITAVRFDSFATLDQKLGDLMKMEYVQFDQDTSNAILNLSDSHWQTIQQESLSVMEQVMRRSIRDDQVADARRSVPTFISFSLSDDEATIVTSIVTPFVAANSLFSQEQTDQARQAAADAIQPVTRSFLAGETIVRRGQIINSLIYEALDQYGLISQNNQQSEIWASVSLVGLMAVFIGLYFSQRRVRMLDSLKGLLFMSVTFILFLYAAKAFIPNRTILPYMFPLAAFGLTVASLYGLEVGMVFPLVLSILTAYGISNSLDLTIFYILTNLVGILVLGKGRRIASFFWAGIAIGVSGSAVILAYRLTDTVTDWIGIATLIGASFLNGLASASLALLLQFLTSQLLGETTALQLMDLLRPDHPLLQQLLRTMPGSYQHSLQVANLAEQAAEAIGADALLTRAGATYHDAGKSLNPSFFIENQVQGKIDSHDELKPEDSAQIIIRHVNEGVNLARKYHLPSRIQDFIREHHGTMVTRYQYAQAVKAAGNDPDKVDIENFRYPGPAPRSRETALLMLADGVEARARAELPKDEDELRRIIRSVIEFCQKEGQLDNTTLTLRDFQKITESFVNTLRNTYHPRILYPQVPSKNNAAASQTISPATRPATEKPTPETTGHTNG